MMNIEMFEKMGAKRWQKNGMDRLYVNADMIQAICDKYNEGVIPMNRAARECGKLWIDVETGEVGAKGLGVYQDDMVSWTKQFIDEM